MVAWLRQLPPGRFLKGLQRVSPIFSSSEISCHLHHFGDFDGVGTDAHSREEYRAARTREVLELAAASEDPDEVQRLYDEVVLLNVEVAESIVMRYRNRGVPVDDLVQVACLGLVKAARGFDTNKSDNFLGYAVPTILGEVKRFFRDSAWAVRPPRRVQELQAAISASTGELTQQLGRTPTAGELAEALGIETSDVAEALAADGCFSPSSLDRPVGDGEGAALSEVLGGAEGGFDHVEAVVALTPLCRNLSDRDRRIVYLRFFHEWTQSRIASEFGVTQMQISRLLTRILKELREELGTAEGMSTSARSRIAS
ncbi:MAG: SigB/SigF/SigG family RNA polymerase sigma factor [Nocardioidaceae bacterium]|nr:SigB/SigF/SigG family RNA polymerase sigma factor [Nocardioidaceae bacterium]